jgi:predicted metalloprotease with PDZ domain
VRNLDSARANIRAFAKKNRWEDFAEEEFVDTVRIFDEKSVFNKTLLKLAGADTLMELPDTYCAALERRNLLAMSPEFYAKVYPEGIETQSYVKLLTHEIAHRLHVRILKGDEEAMGPIWFYEGFALFVANQFSESTITLTADEMKRIMMEPERGSYQKYSYVFRFFAARVPLGELVASARESNFNERLIEMLK